MGLVCPLCNPRPRSTLSSVSYNQEAAGGPMVGLGALVEELGLSPTLADPEPLCSAFQNMPNVRDHDASVYLRLQGDALSVGGYEANPIFWEEVRRGGHEGGAGGCISASSREPTS